MKVSKFLLFIVIFVLLTLTVIADNTTDKYEIFSIDKCYGDAVVKIRGKESPIPYNYHFENCTKHKIEQYYEYWICPCENNKLDVNFILGKNITHEFDIVLEYYLNTQRDDKGQRTYNFNNLKVNPEQKIEIEKERRLFAMPELNVGIGIIIVIILFMILAIFGIIFWVLYKFLSSKEENKIPEAPKIIKKQLIEKEKEEEDSSLQDEYNKLLEDL